MKYLFYLFLTAALTITVIPPVHAAGEADPYADSITDLSFEVFSEENALGAPDGLYADFRAKDTMITFDMGEGEEGLGNLTLHVRTYDFYPTVRVTLLDANMNEVYKSNQQIATQVTELFFEYSGATPYRYVTIEGVEEEEWSLDAIESANYEGSVNEVKTIEEQPVLFDIMQGELIKLEGSSAVYEVGVDGKRHAFPSEAVFYSWYINFDDVRTVEQATMSAFALGSNVTMRAGTNLVKITTDPKTYAVEPGGVLRWITSEEIALQLYGADWANRVVDVADTFWNNYTIGDNLDGAVHPDGTIARNPETLITYYIDNGTKAEISETDLASIVTSELFITVDESSLLDLYIDVGNFTLTNETEFPY